MTQEDKKLLLVALCEYLPYGVNVSYKDSKGKFCRATVEAVGHSAINCNIHDNSYHDDLSVLPFDKDYIYENPKTAGTYVCTDEVRIFLRPMSSMTEEEKKELRLEQLKDENMFLYVINKSQEGDDSLLGTVIPHYAEDWANKNHFDYRGLIQMGLALEAPEGMYNF